MCNTWCIDFLNGSLKFWPESPIVLEVGSRNVNGSARPICEALSSNYVGVDIEQGIGVDALVDANELTKYFEPESFDVVISTEMIEHVYDWLNVLHQMMSVLKRDGLLILTTRSIGFEIHDHPADHWRYSREDISCIFSRVGEILAIADDMTLGYPCGIGAVIRKKTGNSELEAWRQYLEESCALYNVNISKRITLRDYSSSRTLELPFDQYQRYKIIQEAIDLLRDDRAPLSILDVGGWPGTLKRFILSDKVVVVDFQSTEGVDVNADGCHLPFPDCSFDVVVSSDTFEHIPPNMRPRFLSELVRTTKGLLLLGAPFDDPQVRQAEEILQQLIVVRYEEGYDFIEEHRQNGLPELTETLKLLHDAEFRTVVLPNGYLYRWLMGISFWFLLQSRFHDAKLSARANTFYNQSFYRQDNREPSYRKLVVAARDNKADLSHLSDALAAPAIYEPTEHLMAVQVINLLAQMLTERWSERALQAETLLGQQQARVAEKEQTVQALTAQVAEKEQVVQALTAQVAEKEQVVQALTAQVAEKEQALQALSAQINHLTRELDAIYTSKWWKLASSYWAILARLQGFVRSIGIFQSQRAEKGAEWMQLQQRDAYIQKPSVLLETEISSTDPHGTYDIICFANIDWEARYQRPQQIMTQFARRGHRVFYVIASQFVAPDDKEGFKAVAVAHNIFQVRLRGRGPLNFYHEAMSQDIESLFLSSLERLRHEFQIKSAISMVHLSFWTPLVLHLRERWGWAVIYDCMDEWVDFPNIGHSILEQEERLIQESDVVTVTAALLEEKWAAKSKQCLLARNGVDFDFFAKHHRPNDLLKNVCHPLIGYYGALAEWVDFELIHFLASQRSDWHFVLIGDIFVEHLAGIDTLPNVHLLGRRPYGEMPLYLYHFDVCLIPFKLNDVTHAVDPVKFYEFISAGKPIVAVPLSELLVYEEYLYLADTPAGFLEKIELALGENDPVLANMRIALAQENDWLDRYKKMNHAITQLYGKASIIIVTYNNVELTQLCVESIFRNTTYPNYNIILVDNHSQDGTRNYLRYLARNYENVKIILNNENKGFAAANNQGLRIATGEYLVLLNNDTVVSKGWLTSLVRHLRNLEVGLVGPVTNFAGNEAKIDVSYETLEEMESFAADYTRQREGEVFDISMLAMYCVAMRRDVFDRIGPLDERFGVGLFEDDDYSYRMKDKGYRVICAKDAFVHHFGQAAFRELLARGEYQQIWDANQAYFEDKWGEWIPPSRSGR